MRLFSLAVLLLSCTATLAQTPAPYSAAQRDRDEEIARRYAQTLMAPAAGLDTQYTRWTKPVCFSVYGVADATKTALESNLKALARKVGAPVDGAATCPANVSIVFTATPQATLDSIAQTRPFLATGNGEKVLMTRPIQVWYSNYVHDYQGKRIQDPAMGANVFFQLTDKSAPAITNGAGTGAQKMRSNVSHLSTGVVSEMEEVIVMVDTRGVEGVPLGTLGDYLALTILAQVRTDSCRQLNSVANLMANGCDKAFRSLAITEADIAMLTALYETPTEPERLHQQRVITAMRQNLEAQTARK